MSTAIKFIEKSDLVSKAPIAMYYLGICYAKTGEYLKAKEQYEKAISMDYFEAYNDLAYLYAYGNGVEKNMNEAIRMINIVLDKYPDNTNFLDTKGEFLLEQKKFNEAKSLWSTILHIDNKYVEANSKYAQGMRELLNINVKNGVSLYISEFYLDENDITANQHGNIVYDQNGEKCALLKFQTLKTGFTFDVGSLGITKTEQHSGEIWVYVPKGIKRISIHHPVYGIIKNFQIPIPIEKAKTYVVTIINNI